MPFDGTKLDDVTKILIAGRARIERGWCQGDMRAQGGRFCMAGAVFESVDACDVYVMALDRLYDAIADRRWPNIARWNDDPSRTKKEVLAVFDKAIARG